MPCDCVYMLKIMMSLISVERYQCLYSWLVRTDSSRTSRVQISFRPAVFFFSTTDRWNPLVKHGVNCKKIVAGVTCKKNGPNPPHVPCAWSVFVKNRTTDCFVTNHAHKLQVQWPVNLFCKSCDLSAHALQVVRPQVPFTLLCSYTTNNRDSDLALQQMV
jgi:hypothetical protein